MPTSEDVLRSKLSKAAAMPESVTADHAESEREVVLEKDEFGLTIRRKAPALEADDHTEESDIRGPSQPAVVTDSRTNDAVPIIKMSEKPPTKGNAPNDNAEDDLKAATALPIPATRTSTPMPQESQAPVNLAKTCTEAANKEVPLPEQAKTAIDAPKPATVALDAEDVINNQVKAEGAEGQTIGHKRNKSSTNGISEWSHQQAAPKAEVRDGDDSEGEWQTMPAFAPFDMYNDDNKLIAREQAESDEEDLDQGLGGAGKGYTRVQLDEDAQSATSMDENTQYLFKEVNGTSAAGFDDEETRDAVSQMQATKDLLTEGQRIAYVGMTRLALSVMVKEAKTMENTTRGSRKETALAAEAMKMWSQKMMVRLYAHMDISQAEQIMIEQLAEHGVEPADLTPTLMANARVKNPMAEKGPETPTTPSGRPDSSMSLGSSTRDSISSSKIYEEEAAAPPPAYEEHDGEDLPAVRTPSQLPTTKSIDIDLRWTVLCDLFLTLIADSVYDARSRVLLEHVGQHLDISWLEICRFEKRVTDALEMQQAAEKENWNEDEHKEHRRKAALKKRYMMMGLATVGGSLVIGLSAGLLAPVIGAGLAAGFTTIGVAGTSGFLAGAGGAAIITSAAATSGGVIAVRAADRRTGAVKTFEYRPLHNNKRVNLIVTVSGWMAGKVDDVRLPYSTIDPIMGDIYSVLWEPEMLTSMGQTINILATEALTQGLQQVLGSTILVGLMAALQLPVVLTKLAYLIDNPWTVSLDRANMAGLILADSLIDRNLGTRPITFVGYSLGSRVIFSCLRELARKGAYGLVQNVYLFGSPIVAKRDEYLKARTVVAGRFVNGYAKNDWILGYLFRLTSGGISRVAGLAPVEGIPGLENVDVTELVPGHMSYRTAMPKLLRQVGWSVESDEFTEIEDPDPDNHQERQRELINEIEEARKDFEKQEQTSKGKFGFFSRKKKNVVEKKEWETYQETKPGEEPLRTEDSMGNNHGVLFDIDAIRAELEVEHMEVKELKSTLPPMKLNISATPSPVPSPWVNLRETKSYDANSMLRSPSYVASPSATQSPSYLSSSRTFDYDEGDSHYSSRDGDIQMSFEPAYTSQTRPSPSLGIQNDFSRSSVSFDHRAPSSLASPGMPPQVPPKPDQMDRTATSRRPSLKSSNTLPVGSGAGMSAEHNAWADDDDEFREKEMEMTFA